MKVNKEYILNLPIGTEYKVYNPLTKQYKTEIVSKNDIAHNKHCYSGLEFYIKDEFYDESIPKGQQSLF